MSRRVLPLTMDLLSSLPEAVRTCVCWELAPVQRAGELSAVARTEAKERWVSAVLLEWGSCGQVVLCDDEPAGYLLYAPAALVPSADSVATSPASRDAVLVTTGEVFPGHRGEGLGRLLVQTAVKDVMRRQVRALEVFADRSGSSAQVFDARVLDARHSCMLPAGFLGAVGFRTVRPHPRTPRMRLDVRSVATWRADVGNVMDRLLGGLRTRPAPIPN